MTAPPAPPPEALHLPFEPGPFRMAMGLQPCPPDELIELDDRYGAEMAERRALLDTRRGEVWAAEPGSEPARAAVLALLAELLPRRFPAWFERHRDTLHNRLTGEAWNVVEPRLDPLELAGRLVQEDLCIVRPDPAGPVLAAALLCAPSRWRLAEKIGRPLQAVHAPVPGYRERLGAPVDRLMAQLKPGRVALRLNWSVVDDPALFQPTGKHRMEPDPTITAANAADRLHLRVERQTLSQLPGLPDVLFTIRVHSYKLGRVAAIPGEAARLAASIAALPDPMAAYKSLPVFRATALAYLDQVARSDRGAAKALEFRRA